MVQSYYKDNYRPFKKGESLPKISTSLDSVRSYQFEIQFYGLPSNISSQQQIDLTLGAKVVNAISYGVDDIKVNRVNDVVYYPGLPLFDTLSISFDNLYLKKTCSVLWNWFKTIYDPITGDMTKLAAPGGSGNLSFKAAKLRVVELDNTRTPHAAMEFYGVYPKTVRFSEKNYSTGDFATIDVDFRFDFMDYFNY